MAAVWQVILLCLSLHVSKMRIISSVIMRIKNATFGQLLKTLSSSMDITKNILLHVSC